MPGSCPLRSSGLRREIANCWYFTASVKFPADAHAAASVSIEKAFCQLLSVHAFVASATALRLSRTWSSFAVARIQAKSLSVEGLLGSRRTACSYDFRASPYRPLSTQLRALLSYSSANRPGETLLLRARLMLVSISLRASLPRFASTNTADFRK